MASGPITSHVMGPLLVPYHFPYFPWQIDGETVETATDFILGGSNLGVHTLTSEFADKMMQMTDEMVPSSPSMKLDFDYHRPMEIEYLYSHPIAEAKKVGFDMPKLAMLEAELKFIEAQQNR